RRYRGAVMSEWWTYGLSDFLLFSPQTYQRLFELHNAALWPAQVAALAAGIAVILLGMRQSRGTWILAALAWLLVAWLWFHQRYATINWAADWIAIAFVLQALLLLWQSLRRKSVSGSSNLAGLAFMIFAVAALPLLPLLLGRPWRQAEIFALTPGPTVIATFGLLLMLRAPRHLLILPLLWCAIDGATLWAMDAPEFWLLPAAGLLTVAMTALRRA
ncbi:MAG: DUF6064 family protein, partial [Ferrovibrio sp.]|uniref:DUF6064 family protein n=1 Tax=Ferrovibrio sp. TaxID=1917215 RepID=UPI00391B77F4